MLWFQVAISSCIMLLGTVWWTDRFATNVRSPSCLMGVNLVNTFNIKLPDDNVRNRSIHHLYWTIWTIIQKSRIKNSCMILLICPSPIMHTHPHKIARQHACNTWTSSTLIGDPTRPWACVVTKYLRISKHSARTWATPPHGMGM